MSSHGLGDHGYATSVSHLLRMYNHMSIYMIHQHIMCVRAGSNRVRNALVSTATSVYIGVSCVVMLRRYSDDDDDADDDDDDADDG